MSTINQEPQAPPNKPAFTLTEDWLATLIALVIIVIIAAGVLTFEDLLPWPPFGLFG